MVKTQVQNKFHEYISLYWTIKFWTVQFFFYLFTLKHARYEQKASWFKVTDLPFKITFSGLSRQLPHHGPFFFLPWAQNSWTPVSNLAKFHSCGKLVVGLKSPQIPSLKARHEKRRNRTFFLGLCPVNSSPGLGLSTCGSTVTWGVWKEIFSLLLGITFT